MEKIQIKFLQAISKKEKNAIELCKELEISTEVNERQGKYYNALLREIHYKFEEEDELGEMFEIKNNIGV